MWLEKSFVGNIRAQEWYNKDPPRNLSGYLNDKNNRLIGWARMRQLRVKSNICEIDQRMRSHFNDCDVDFSWKNEEKRSFSRGWKNETSEMSINSSIDRSFVYESNGKVILNAISGKHGRYSGGVGGFVFEYRGRLEDLRQNLTKLHELQWIDSRTRAVIIEITLYNPNVQLFTSVILLAEFLSTGGVEASSRFEPISFQRMFLFLLIMRQVNHISLSLF